MVTMMSDQSTQSTQRDLIDLDFSELQPSRPQSSTSTLTGQCNNAATSNNQCEYGGKSPVNQPNRGCTSTTPVQMESTGNLATWSDQRAVEFMEVEFGHMQECFTRTKQLLQQQFEESQRKWAQELECKILAIRQKHSVCEKNFKDQIESISAKCQEWEKRFVTEQSANRDKVNWYEEELIKTRQSARDGKVKLENVITSKDRMIDELKSEKQKLDSQSKLQSSEFQSQRDQFHLKIQEYDAARSKDLQEIKRLKDDLSKTSRETTHLQRVLQNLEEKLKQSETILADAREESNRSKGELEAESKTKQELVKKVETLNELNSRRQGEIEDLQRKLTELEEKGAKEVKDFAVQLAASQASVRELKNEKTQIERNLKEEVASLRRSVRKYQFECESLKSEVSKKEEEKESLQQQLTQQIDQLRSEKDLAAREHYSATESYTTKLEETRQKITELTTKYDQSQEQLVSLRTQLIAVEGQLKTKTTELVGMHEKYNLLELSRASVMDELNSYREQLELEVVKNREKARTIESLNETLQSSHIEISNLQNVNEKLQRTIQESESLLDMNKKDREELRDTLAEVERSRLEIKSKLNITQSSLISHDKELKLKESEIAELNARMKTLAEEKRVLQDSLDRANKSLTQMKDTNKNLNHQMMSWKSQLESSRSASSSSAVSSTLVVEKENELRRAKREIEKLRDRNALLESEKKRVQRSYAHLENEHTALQKRLGQSRQNSSDQSSRSLLELTKMVDPSLFNASSRPFEDTVTRRNVDSVKPTILPHHTRSSDESDDCSECSAERAKAKLIHLLNDPDLNGNGVHHSLEDEDDHDSRLSIEDKTALLESQAQQLIDSYEEELKKVSASSRIKSSYGRRSAENGVKSVSTAATNTLRGSASSSAKRSTFQ